MDIPLIDQVKIQAQVLVPLVRALRTEMGKEKADALVKTALSAWSREMFSAIGKDIEGGRRRWSKMQGALNQISNAFGKVTGSLQFLLTSWSTIVELQSVHKRLRAFEATLQGEPLPPIDQRYLERQSAEDPA